MKKYKHYSKKKEGFINPIPVCVYMAAVSDAVAAPKHPFKTNFAHTST